jgi:hypothetical protein
MKASIAHGIRPTALILGKDSKKPWTREDILFAKAYQRFLNEICGQCGYPKYICHTDDGRIQFDLHFDECAATAKVEDAQAARTKKELKDYGRRVYAEPVLTEEAIEAGLEMSDFRRPYIIETMKKRGMVPEDTDSMIP